VFEVIDGDDLESAQTVAKLIWEDLHAKKRSHLLDTDTEEDVSSAETSKPSDGTYLEHSKETLNSRRFYRFVYIQF